MINFQSELFKHEDNCQYRIVECPRLDCFEKHKFCKIMVHFKEKHPLHQKIEIGSMKTKKDILQVDMDGFYFSYWPWLMVEPLELKIDNKDFLFMVYRCDDKKIWYFYVVMIGSKMNSKNYKSIISLTAADDVSIQ